MAHMAKIDKNNMVIDVVVVHDNYCPDPAPQNESVAAAFLDSLGLGLNWKQTSYNGNFRKQYASIGYTYDADADVFVRPQPFPSWSLNENHDWVAPVEKPNDGKLYIWNEALLSWEIDE